MFDVNPETHRHHLAELERRIQPRSRPLAGGARRAPLPKRVKATPALLALVSFILGGFAGGTLL